MGVIRSIAWAKEPTVKWNNGISSAVTKEQETVVISIYKVCGFTK